MSTSVDVVTGAFSYSGRAIAAALMAHGRTVRTLTGHPGRAPAGSPIDVRPLNFMDSAGLTESLRGTTTLYNTYWVRFAYGHTDHDGAVENSRRLFQAAARAGVSRIVHVSITNPTLDSPFPYFRGKALVEEDLAACGVSYAIVRPAILFGGDGVLINNIAWLLRHVPVFAIGGRGQYRIRGIHIDDLARLCLLRASERTTTVTDAVGPERPTFNELVSQIRSAVHSRAVVVHVPGRVLTPCARVLGTALGDVLLTRDEYDAMAAGLADTLTPSTGSVRVSEWILDNAATLGTTYAHELRRHFEPSSASRAG